MNFYRRLQGIYRKFHRRFYRKRPKLDFGGLKGEKQWERGNEGWIDCTTIKEIEKMEETAMGVQVG